MVILTSGTTGQPKGAARRSDPAAIEGVAAVLERIPFRLGDTQVIAAPLFHGWGLTNLLLGIGRCTTNVLSRRFDAEATLRATSEHRARVLVVVPVMLSRILALDPDVLVSAPTTRPARDRVEWLGPRQQARHGGARPLRTRPLQPVRIDRGRRRHHRHTGRPARGTGDGGPSRPWGARRDSRRPRHGRPRGHGRARLRRRFDAVRRLHHRWDQGGATRVAVVGRSRATSATDCCSSKGARTT